MLFQDAEEVTESAKVEVVKAVENYFELTDETFPKHVAEGAHFVKFYAPWCSHCQVIKYLVFCSRKIL